MTQALTHPVLGVRLWQSLSVNEIPREEPITQRWRWSQYKPDRLYGLQHGDPALRIWRPGVNQAICGRLLIHVAPQQNCSCGLHAYHDYSEIPFGAEMGPGEPWPYVAGIIRGWGQVFSHPNGWRAEKAEILALFSDWGGAIPRLPTIAAHYEVPLLSKVALPEILSEFGDPVPQHMRPEPR